MRSTLTALTIAAFGSLLAAAPATAGQIVFNTGDEIRVANDDGGGQRTLIAPGDVPGAVSLYDPFVQPGSKTVVFTARTPYAGYNGLYCGFSCAGVYRWDAGQITRLSLPPSPCPPGDLCTGLDVEGKISADGSRYFYEQIYAEPSGYTFDSISHSFEGPAVAGGAADATEQTGDCARPTGHVYSPAGRDVVYVDCEKNSYDQGIKFRPAGGDAVTLATDAGTPTSLAWRPDGRRVADSENGSDPGIWTVAVDAANPDPRQVVSLEWDADNSQSGASPAYVGNDRIAFVYGGAIRVAGADCQACTVDATTKLVDAPGASGLAWTGQTLPVVTRGSGQQNQDNQNNQQGQGSNNNQQGQQNNQNGGGTSAALVPRAVKLAAALKGLTVPFKASGAGTLSLKAQLDAKTAKKLKLIKKGTKPVSVASGKASPRAAGDGSVKLKFTKTAAKRLRKAKSLKLKLVGTFTPTGGGGAQNITATVSLKR